MADPKQQDGQQQQPRTRQRRSSLRNVLEDLRRRQGHPRRPSGMVPEALEPRQLLSVSVQGSDGVEPSPGNNGVPASIVVDVQPSDGNLSFQYGWLDFGDGSGSEFTLTHQTIAHTYQDPGNYGLNATVVDWSGQGEPGSGSVFVDEALVTVTPKTQPTGQPPGYPDPNNPGPAPQDPPPTQSGSSGDNPGTSGDQNVPSGTNGVESDPAVNAPIPGLFSGGFDRVFKKLFELKQQYTTEPDIPADPDGDPYYASPAPDPRDSALFPHMIEAVDAQTGNMMIGVVWGVDVEWFETNSGPQNGPGVRGAIKPGSGFDDHFDDGFTLNYPAGGNTLTVADRSGLTLVFNDFSAASGKLSGQLEYAMAPNGDTLMPGYDGNGNMTSEEMTATVNGVTTDQLFTISYANNKISNILLQRTVDGTTTNVQQAAYTYYGSGDANGDAGELQTVTIEDGSGNAEQVYLYRYWTSGSGEPDGLLKSYLGADAYARAAASLPAGVTPLTASDDQLAPYVDRYYQYDGSGNPTEMIAQGQGCSSCAGGQGTYLFSYTTNSNANPADYNSWALKTTITLPDLTTQYHYYNTNGMEMLSVTSDGTHLWGWFTAYDTAGRVALFAAPSAVDLSAGLATLEQYGDLLHKVNGSYQYLNNSSGEIETMSYYAATTATASSAGGVAGYLADWYLQNGQAGTPVHQEDLTYYAFANSFGSVTVYPVAADTVYGNADGTDPRTTSYGYTTYSGTVAIASQTTTYPVISSAQNGPGVADVESAYFDSYGNPIWTEDGDGRVNSTAYDLGTGAVVETITDVSYASLTADQQTSFNQTGWSHPSGLNLVTTYQVDGLGRTTEETDPNGNKTYTVYNDLTHEVRVYPGFNGTATTGPIQVTREYYPAANSAGFYYTETLTSSATPHLTGGVPDGTETIDASNIQSLERDFTNGAGQVIWSDKYASLSGVTYSQPVAADSNGNPIDLGTSGTNFYRTVYGFDELGRQDAVYLPTGTIDRTVFDALGRQASAWVGTSDTHTGDDWTPATNTGNMIDVQDEIYDNGGVGDSNLTETIQHPDPAAADARVTLNLFDWRDHLIASKQGALLDSNGNPNPAGETDGVHRLITATSYDNLDEAVATATYAGDGVSLGDFATWMPSADASKLRAYSTQSFDDQGRVYLGLTYSVDPTSGMVGASLATNYFFDHRGNEIEESDPGGIVTKHAYDGADRDVKDSTTDGGVLNGAAQTWPNAGTTTNDVVLEQTLNTYDGDDNLILSVDRQRFDSDPTTATGDLAGPAGGTIASRDYYTASYYDAADRLTDSVNLGTNGGVVWARPSSVPTGSDTVLVTHDDYDMAGNLRDTIDPRGIKSGTFYDMLGRQIETIAAWDGSQNPTPTPSTNQITTYTFDGDDNILTMTAVVPSGTPSQATAYIYGVGGAVGTNLFSNDLIAKVEYPDATTGQASGAATDDQTFGYDNLGETISFTDQNGTTHQYRYDVLARLTADIAMTLGAGVDGFIRALGYSFNDAGLPYQQTSYYDTSLANIANQVQDAYSGYDQLTTEYQNNAGAVNTSTTPAIHYGYSQPTGANYSRPATLTYPGGRVVDYDYTSGIDTTISRLSGISDSGGNIESYSYLGLDTIVRKIRPGSVLTLVKANGASNGDAGDIYTGLDRFGRVADQEWVTSDTPNGTSGDSLGTVTDRFQYGYDQDSNVLYRNNLVNSAYSELYHANGAGEPTAYDSLNRLTAFRRGTLSASGNNGTTLDTVTTASATDSWTLDALGNSINAGGIARTFNGKNQISTYNGSSSIAYDHDGNMTTDQAGNTYHFDAWNRMVAAYLANNPNFPSEFWTYDALGRRPGLTITNGAITNSYYSANWQDLEDDVTLGMTHTVNTFVWSGSHIDDVVERDQSVNGGTATRVYAQQDANHDVTSLVNTSGSVLQRFAYAPYGSRTVLTAAWAITSDAYGWLIGLQGGRLDPLTGSVNFRNRDLNTGLDVWMEQDYIGGYVNGMDLYEPMLDNPVATVDPFGTQCAAPVEPSVAEPGVEDGGEVGGETPLPPEINLPKWEQMPLTGWKVPVGPQPAPYPNPPFAAPPGYYWYSGPSMGAPGTTGRPLLLPIPGYKAPPGPLTPLEKDAQALKQLLANSGGKNQGPPPPAAPPGGPSTQPSTQPSLPGDYWKNKKAPTQVQPGTKQTSDSKPSSRKQGEVYDRRTYYDDYGRSVGQTHFTDHGEPDVHPNPHYHLRDPRTGQERGPFPGVHPNDPCQ